MSNTHEPTGLKLVRSQLGERAAAAVDILDLDALLRGCAREGDGVDRTTLAAALNVLLFDDLVRRVPSAASYVQDRRSARERICFDHGAIRTIRLPAGDTGALPAGEKAFARLLKPLGYEVAGVYPLPRLRMTGRAYVHSAAPHDMPQFFVSELHVEQFDLVFQAAATNVFESSSDPIRPRTDAALASLAAGDHLPLPTAEAVLADLLAAFGRQHDVPRVSDYEVLLAGSAEAAWIATEGNAFNHATDRVSDVEALSIRERLSGRPIKDTVEVSSSGRVRQTAYRAATVRRPFFDHRGELVERDVPGSFYEFITRDLDPDTGAPDLRFDSGNATGIFAMTRAA